MASIGHEDFGGAGSEDCLKVDVYTPSDRASAPFPVLAYIHVSGCASERPERLSQTRPHCF